MKSRELTHDFWPVVADSFVGILAVIVFVFIGYKPNDPKVESFRSELETRLADDKRRGTVKDFEVGRSRVRIIYSAEALSFATCEWELPEDKAAIVRKHMRWFNKRVDLIDRIQIEGHADKRSVDGCREVKPYRDNLQLSQNRARALYNALLGLAPKAVVGLEAVLAGDAEAPDPPEGLAYIRSLSRHGQLQVAGFGATRPLDDAHPEAEINRRVEIIVVFKD